MSQVTVRVTFPVTVRVSVSGVKRGKAFQCGAWPVPERDIIYRRKRGPGALLQGCKYVAARPARSALSGCLGTALPSVCQKVSSKVCQKVYVTCCMVLHCNTEAGACNMLPIWPILCHQDAPGAPMLCSAYQQGGCYVSTSR